MKTKNSGPIVPSWVVSQALASPESMYTWGLFEDEIQTVSPVLADDQRECPQSTDGKHKPDPKTVTIEFDGDGVYFDVACSVCGASGCAGKFNESEVDW